MSTMFLVVWSCFTGSTLFLLYVIAFQISGRCNTEYCIDFAEEIEPGEDNILLENKKTDSQMLDNPVKPVTSFICQAIPKTDRWIFWSMV